MIEILNNTYATITVFPEKGILHHTIHQPLQGESFRHVMKTAVDAYLDNNCDKWLSDDRNNNSIHFEDMDWAEKLWMETVIPAGWKYWALIPSSKIKVQANFHEVITAYRDRGVFVELFHDVEKAMKWLESK